MDSETDRETRGREGGREIGGECVREKGEGVAIDRGSVILVEREREGECIAVTGVVLLAGVHEGRGAAH